MFQKIKDYFKNKENQKDFLISLSLGLSLANFILFLFICSAMIKVLDKRNPESIKMLDQRYERLPEQKNIGPQEFIDKRNNELKSKPSSLLKDIINN